MTKKTSEVTKKVSYTKKVEEFKSRILPAKSVLIATHDYPDPDCLASAFGISKLLTFWGVESTVITFGGFVGRAENRAMIRVTGIQSVPFVLISPSDYDRIVLVDSFPGHGNVSLDENTHIDAVLDHHPNNSQSNKSFYSDVRIGIGATSTIVTQYLQNANCPITPELATALFYGIKTDTNDMARSVSSEDVECYRKLFDLMDFNMLSAIETPQRDAEYFRVIHRTIESMVTFGNLGYAHLGAVTSPDFIAEIADMFHSLETLEWVVCTGIFKNQIFYSVRSETEENAGFIAEKLAENLNGNGGGHMTMAAGRIPITDVSEKEILKTFLENLKTILKIDKTDGNFLLSK